MRRLRPSGQSAVANQRFAWLRASLSARPATARSGVYIALNHRLIICSEIPGQEVRYDE